MAEPVLKISGVAKSYGANQVLKDINLEVGAQEIVGLLGPNGCGKSTLLNLSSGFARADAGSIIFGGHDITAWGVERIAQAGLVRTFQLPSMPHRMTVAEVLRAADSRGVQFKTMFAPDRSSMQEVDALLEGLSLSHVRNLPAGSLSGGQKKLLSIALALRTNPKLICLDEPTAGVHPNLRHSMVQLLRRVSERGIALLIVEHDMHFIRELCSRCVVLDRGEVIANCVPASLTSNERVVEAYLGSARDKGAIA
ncbi:MAG: ABC transporter ATP-binding protein [Rhizobiales bacterium 63-7]|nr:ABC transporter ATP-binding protein [Hyphomicrobiales bacterium]OJU68130.1 MAG: ABC transporter ATP-binding protein [Rhizobiales bacterium 63-7]